jgi:hypothetical protein
MIEAARRLEFEYAASLRNRMARLELLRSEFLRLRDNAEGLSFLYAVPGFGGDHRIYAIRSGTIREVFKAPDSSLERRDLLKRAEVHFSRPEGAWETAAPARINELLLISQWFRTHPGERSNTYPRDRWTRIPLAKQLDEQPKLA